MLNKIQERLVVRERKDDLRRLDITDLEEMLTDAVRDEDYEFASRLRDVIKERRCDEV